MIRLLLSTLLLLPALAASAQVPAPADSAAAVAPADTLASAPADSASAPAAGDSLAAGRSAPAAIARDLGPLQPPWTRRAELDSTALAALRPRGLDDVVEALPGASLRVAGDRGYPAFVDLGPLDGGRVEMLADGVPALGPADDHSPLWDLSAAPLGWAEGGAGAGAAGGSALLLASDPPLRGRTLLRTHFHKAPRETYLRQLSFTTPRAPRTLRLDFEEWKTEEGYDFSGRPDLDAAPGYGKSKMRRFEVSTGVHSSVGRVRLGFGRGRRLHVGTVASTGTLDRWTGRLWTGLDRESASHHLRLRLYHLDWHQRDGAHPGEEQDAARDGVRLVWSAREGGWSAGLDVERWDARFRARGSFHETPTRHQGRLRVGFERPGETGLGLRAVLEGAWSEQATDPLAPAGEVEAWLGGGAWSVGASGRRVLRTPSLLETSGVASFDLPGAFTLTRLPAGRLPFETRDRLRAALRRRGEGLSLEVGVERWRLRDGIGWIPETPAAVSGDAFTVGGLAYDLDQITVEGEVRLGARRHGLSLRAHGHAVLGDLPRDASRGAGWPERGGFLTVRWWHDLLSRHDQIRVLYRLRYQGPRWDDLLTPFSAEGELVQAAPRQDLRVALKLRDAELYLEVHNLLGAELVEVSGTRRRDRNLLWGMVWPFFN